MLAGHPNYFYKGGDFNGTENGSYTGEFRP